MVTIDTTIVNSVSVIIAASYCCCCCVLPARVAVLDNYAAFNAASSPALAGGAAGGATGGAALANSMGGPTLTQLQTSHNHKLANSLHTGQRWPKVQLRQTLLGNHL